MHRKSNVVPQMGTIREEALSKSIFANSKSANHNYGKSDFAKSSIARSSIFLYAERI